MDEDIFPAAFDAPYCGLRERGSAGLTGQRVADRDDADQRPVSVDVPEVNA